jgi:hypothetical protein
VNEADAEKLLRLLVDAELPFTLVGGLAAISHGSSTFTRDVDVAMPLDEDTLPRLLAALAPVHPRHVTRPDLGLVTDPTRLRGFRLLLLDTDLGRLDVLGELPPLGDVRELPTVERVFGNGLIVRVLALDALIAVKAHVGRAKDGIVEAELRAIRSAIAAKGSSEP